MLFWCCSSLHQSWCSVSGFDKAWPSSNPKITFILQIPEPPRHLAATGCFFYFVCCQYLLFFRVCGMVKHATFVIVPPHPRAQLSGLSPAPLCLAFALSLSKKKTKKKHPGRDSFLSYGFGLIVSSIKWWLALGCSWINPVSCQKFTGLAAGLLTKVLREISIPRQGEEAALALPL